jgi:hypothetical protein
VETRQETGNKRKCREPTPGNKHQTKREERKKKKKKEAFFFLEDDRRRRKKHFFFSTKIEEERRSILLDTIGCQGRKKTERLLAELSSLFLIVFSVNLQHTQ